MGSQFSDLNMPKSKEYVSSDSSGTSDSETETKNVKRKKEQKKEKPAKKAKKEEKEDENVWELGQNRFVEIKEFKGKTYVDVREKYMDKDSGDLKPGKKGIFLTISQWKKLAEVVGEVNDALEQS